MPEHHFDMEHAERDPSAVFATPEEVLAHPELNHEQKLRILRRWRLDALDLEVATEENMGDGEPSMLERVTNALMSLEGEKEGDAVAPTKQGF